jgi:hypothetical protein
MNGQFQPRFFSASEFQIITSAIDVLIPEQGRLLQPQEVAQRADIFLQSVEAPNKDNIRTALFVLDHIFPVILLHLEPFTEMTRPERRELLEKLMHFHGLFHGLRDVVRLLKLLGTFNYYTDSKVRNAIGYVEFDLRPRSQGADQTPAVYPPPQ